MQAPPSGEKPPLCECGCDQPVEWNSKHGRWNHYVHGHNLKDPDQLEKRLDAADEEEDEDVLERRMTARLGRFDDE